MALAKNEEESETKKTEKFLLNINRLLNEFFLFTENDQNRPFIQFVIEQFQLIFTSKKQRRYSSELLMMSYVIFATNAKVYERLLEEKVIMLPSMKTLEKITINLDKRTGLDDKKYLQMRYSQLNAFDRNILVMIDEIYVFKRIEATRGHILGLTDNCEIASTALCFMVKSLNLSF